MPTDRTKALARRLERVAEEAEDLFAREGFLHFSTTQIAQRLRCSKTTIYSIAPSREKFFELIATRVLKRLNQKWIDAI
jgi:AcrR family transcriptional regulator